MSSTTAESIVTNAHLQSVLVTAKETRDSCLTLLELLDASIPEHPHLDLPAQHKQVYSQLAKIRTANRDAVLGARATKQSTAEARSEVDRLHLQLQNLYYEQRHLRGEIGACESYNHKYTTLPLVPVDTFLELFPDHTSSDEHTLMVARISHEHAERQALEERRQGLLKKKQVMIAENKRRREDLASLDIELEKFVNTAEPIQKIFDRDY